MMMCDCNKTHSLDELCPTCREEYETWLADQAETAALQEQYEDAA
jgi:hypothetical protein